MERYYLQDIDFLQNNTYFYFTELETQDAWLLLVAGGGATETVLFLPPRNPFQERWTGLRLGPDSTAVRVSGVARVLPPDSLDALLSAALFRVRGPLYVPLDPTPRFDPPPRGPALEDRRAPAGRGAHGPRRARRPARRH